MRIALIGHGMVAQTHIRAIEAENGLELAGVLGRVPSRARKFCATHGIDTVFETTDALIQAAPDFAILTTPPDNRFHSVDVLSAARIPILMEKPIERTARAARSIVELCEARKTPLGIVFQMRGQSGATALKDELESGALGKISHIDIRVPWWRDQSYYDVPGRGTYARDGGGVMLTQAIHTLDLALWLLGPVARVSALLHTTPLHNLEAEDWAGGLLEFESGAVGSLNATTASFPGQGESLTVHGTKAMAHLSGGVLRIETLSGEKREVGLSGGSGGGADPMGFTHEWHQAVIADFAAALASARSPMCSGREGLGVHNLIDAMERSSASRQWQDVAS